MFLFLGFGMSGVRLVDKLSGPRASNVIRLEVGVEDNSEQQIGKGFDWS